MTARTELVEQIVRLLDIRLLDPLEILLDGDDAVDAMRRLVRIRAGRWADEMLTGDDDAAVGVAARLISALYPADRAFDPPPEWWRTPVGRVVARRVVHPAADSVSYATLYFLMPGAFSTAWPPPGSPSTTRTSRLSAGSCLLTSSSSASRSRSRSNGVISSVTNASVSSMRIFMRRIVLRS